MTSGAGSNQESCSDSLTSRLSDGRVPVRRFTRNFINIAMDCLVHPFRRCTLQTGPDAPLGMRAHSQSPTTESSQRMAPTVGNAHLFKSMVWILLILALVSFFTMTGLSFKDQLSPAQEELFGICSSTWKGVLGAFLGLLAGKSGL